MRHLGSLALSLLTGLIIWMTAGYGLMKYNEYRIQHIGAPELDSGLLLGLSALVVAGLLYAMLMLTRLSPIGPAVVSCIYLAIFAWSLFAPRSLFRLLSTGPLEPLRPELTPPLNGLAFLLAVPLLATVLSPRRWRRYDRGMPALYGGPQGQSSYPPAYPAPPGHPAASSGMGYPAGPATPPQPHHQATPPQPGHQATPPQPGQQAAMPPYQPRQPRTEEDTLRLDGS